MSKEQREIKCCNKCSASREALSQLNPWGRTIWYCCDEKCSCHLSNNPQNLKEEFENNVLDGKFSNSGGLGINWDKVEDFFSSHFSQTIDKMVEALDKAEREGQYIKPEMTSTDCVNLGFELGKSLAKEILLKGKNEIMK